MMTILRIWKTNVKVGIDNNLNINIETLNKENISANVGSINNCKTYSNIDKKLSNAY